MPTLTIDGKEITVSQGTTVYHAAEELGINIPTLCYLKGYDPNTACLSCLVRIKGQPRLTPSCAAVAEEGMIVESESKEVLKARKTAVELLLSDHVGDCMGPCETTCPAHMDIPLMIRQINSGELRDALITVKKRISTPAILGRICPAPCEDGCRRGKYDKPISICLLKRHVADEDYNSDNPYVPECKPPSGKTVAIIGCGPAGMASAYYIQQEGHQCTILDDREKTGGQMRYSIPEEELPGYVIDWEIEALKRIGVKIQLNTRVGRDISLDEIRKQYDAVVFAVGEIPKEAAEKMGFAATKLGVKVDNRTYATSLEGVFCGGDAIQPRQLAVASVGHGRELAASVDQYVRGVEVVGPHREFNSRILSITREEVKGFVDIVDDGPRIEPAAGKHGATGGFSYEEAANETERCLHCDCRARHNCKLQDVSEEYNCNQVNFRGDRRTFEYKAEHHGVIYESGKCISCALCVQIAKEKAEPLGLSFVGRGFKSRVGVPFDSTFDQGLSTVALECAKACPTGAIESKNHHDLHMEEQDASREVRRTPASSPNPGAAENK